MSNRARRRIAPLFTGADSRAYTLPDNLMAARATLDALEREAQTTRVPPDPEGEMLDYVDGALSVGEIPPDLLERAATFQATYNATGLVARVLQRAVDDFEDRLLSSTLGAGERVIVDCLRPALFETLDAVRGAARVLRGALPDPQSLAAGHVSAKVATAAHQVNEAATRYGLIRTARRVLGDLGLRPAEDVDGVFTELRDLPRVWPGFARGEPPWPKDPPARLLWLIDNQAQPWMPLPAEQDARWGEWHTEIASTQAAAMARSMG